MSQEESSHEEAIEQFMAFTGANEERAKILLEACDWNLELAINTHVDTDDGPENGPSTSRSSFPDPPASSAANLAGSIDDDFSEAKLPARWGNRGREPEIVSGPSPYSSDDVRPPIPPVRQVLNPSGYGLNDFHGPSRRYHTRAGASSEYDAFRDFRAEADWQEMALSENEASVSDPFGIPSSANKSRTLQELFRPPLDLIFRGSLTSAREAGSLQNKWLLVNVQDGREFACQTLNRDVWSNQAVKDIVKEHFIFWQVYHDSSEGMRYTQFYNVFSGTYPHISIIDPRTGEQMKSWPTSVDHNSFCDSLAEFLSEFPSPDGSGDTSTTMKKLRVKEEENDVATGSKTLYDESEEAQLEAAIRASLEESENSDSSKSPKQKNEKAVTTEDYQKYLGTDTEKFSTLVIRFPDGSRDQFKFPSDTLMKAIFLLLSSKGYDSKEFNYVTTYPRRLLHELPSTDTLSEAKLLRETIFVERRLGDD